MNKRWPAADVQALADKKAFQGGENAQDISYERPGF